MGMLQMLHRRRLEKALSAIGQELDQFCTFYFGANTAVYVGNNYPLERGDGNLVRQEVAQVPGVIREAVNVSNIRARALEGDAALDAYDGVIFSNNGVDTDFSISLWAANINGTTKSIFSMRRLSPLRGVAIYTTDGELYFTSHTSAGTDNLTTPVPPSQATFTHIYVTFQASTGFRAIYFDGVLQTSSSTGYSGTKGDQEVITLVGKHESSEPFTYTGALDEVAVFKGLHGTQEHVDYLYNNGMARSIPFN